MIKIVVTRVLVDLLFTIYPEF